MLDTNVFNYLLDDYITFDALPTGVEYVVTHIQHDQLNATPDSARRTQLLQMFHHVAAVTMPINSGTWDISRSNNTKWGEGVVYEEILAVLESNKPRKSNTRDALIAETAIKNGWLLVTADEMLVDAVANHSGTAIFLFRRRESKT